MSLFNTKEILGEHVFNRLNNIIIKNGTDIMPDNTIFYKLKIACDKLNNSKIF